MGMLRRQMLLNVLKLFDLLLMILCFGLATLVDSKTVPVSLVEFLSLRVKIGNFAVFFGLVGVWYLICSACGLYASRRLSGRWDEAVDIVKATSLGSLCMAAAAVILQITLLRPIFLLVFWVAVTLSTLIGRSLMRVALRWIRLRGRNLRFLLIVGSNARAVQFAKKIESNPALGYRLLGFVDDEWSGLEVLREEGYPLACDFDGMRVFLRENVVDEVVMALPMRSLHAHASQVAEICEEHGIPLRLTSNLFDLKTARSRSEDFEGDSVVTHYTGTPDGWPMVVKRIFDFAVSLVLIILLAPALLITAILVKLTSPGPVLFFQKRLGLNKRRFSICKFRTMVPDAEKKMSEVQHLNEVSGPVFKIKNDPRITPLGKFLRKTSIDELPQLFNVLKGDMSLVGPRPLPVRDYEGFNEDWQRRRFSVRPGITCLWQVGGRSSIAFEKWMALDLEYIDRWSLWLDFQILLRTIPAILKGSGAA
jgi:exopolysaccharide biosynthesis polyprenyl glycosylphosphotransferase